MNSKEKLKETSEILDGKEGGGRSTHEIDKININITLEVTCTGEVIISNNLVNFSQYSWSHFHYRTGNVVLWCKYHAVWL